MPARHEIPTHLNVEDKAFYGLSARQVMHLTVGLALGYGLWNQTPILPLPGRIALTGLCCGLAVALALIRPGARGLEEWGFVALRYLAVPKASVWRPREPEPDARAAPDDWEALTPRVAWRDGTDLSGGRP